MEEPFAEILQSVNENKEPSKSVVLGFTGTGGAGKSSVTDEVVRRFLNAYQDKTIAVVSVDPSKKNRRRFIGRPHPYEFNFSPQGVYA